MTNTRIDYVYADASNYKVWGHEVLPGTLTADEKAEIFGALHDGELFIASQVGLPDLQPRMWAEHRINDDDHVFHRLSRNDVVDVDEAPTKEVTAEQLLASFRAVTAPRGDQQRAIGWDVVAAARRLGLRTAA